MPANPQLPDLPVAAALPRLRTALRDHRAAVLTAPPGSGKTTVVPLALLGEDWLAGKRILMLEPRRMAARAASWRMADLLGEASGATVGHHMRLERCFGRDTRIIVLTEGLLSRRIAADPELADAGLLVFDEFHERSVNADFGLALALDVQRNLRPDLRILVMSATLDASPVARHLGDAPVVSAEGRMFPVETVFAPRPKAERIAERTAAIVRRALAEQPGSVLAFLPGEGEIRAAAEILGGAASPGTDLVPLYAALPKGEQDAALRPSPPGRRKVVLATSIAESSLTIDGIAAVVDSGCARVSRFSHATGMSRLETVAIARDRADQRRGRAGRLGPGVCYRIWSEEEDARLDAASLPEILTADLAPLALQTADWSSSAADSLPWLTPPPASTWRQALDLLTGLQALDSAGRITPRGRRMARLGTHPRLAHAMIEAAACGDAESRRNACLLAAILSEGPAAGARLSSNIAHLLGEIETPRGAIAPAVRQRIRELAASWNRELDGLAVAESAPRPLSVGLLLAWAYPDRIGLGRKLADDAGRYLLSGGRGAKLRPGDPLAASDWICVAEIDDRDADATIRLAAPIAQAEVERHFSHLFHTVAAIAWNARAKRVEAAEREMFGDVQVRERPLKDPDDAAILACLCDGIRQEGVERLNWTDGARNLQARIRVVAAAMPEEALPDVSDEALAATLERWIGPSLYGMRSLAQAADVDLTSALLGLLGPAARRLDALAPTHLRVPSGSNIRIDYTEAQPAAAVRIQEVFGMMRTPSVAGGRVRVLLKLLSPAQRPVQITADLESFWKNGYPEVRKDLRGRYPRHYWPEDPSQAEPTRRVRPR